MLSGPAEGRPHSLSFRSPSLSLAPLLRRRPSPCHKWRATPGSSSLTSAQPWEKRKERSTDDDQPVNTLFKLSHTLPQTGPALTEGAAPCSPLAALAGQNIRPSAFGCVCESRSGLAPPSSFTHWKPSLLPSYFFLSRFSTVVLLAFFLAWHAYIPHPRAALDLFVSQQWDQEGERRRGVSEGGREGGEDKKKKKADRLWASTRRLTGCFFSFSPYLSLSLQTYIQLRAEKLHASLPSPHYVFYFLLFSPPISFSSLPFLLELTQAPLLSLIHDQSCVIKFS